MKPETPLHKRKDGTVPYTTEAEMGFLRGLKNVGQLEIYLQNIEKRQRWDDVDSEEVRRYCLKRIRRLRHGKKRSEKEVKKNGEEGV